MNIPSEVPDRLHHLASQLSWEDCVNLLCLYEGWAQNERSGESREKCRQYAEEMRILVKALPYEWVVPPVDEHEIFTALAEWVRTGKMPLAGRALD